MTNTTTNTLATVVYWWQIGVSALTDGGGDLLHGVVAFGEGQDFLPLQDGEQQSCHRTDKSDPEIVVQNLHAPLYFFRFFPALGWG